MAIGHRPDAPLLEFLEIALIMPGLKEHNTQRKRTCANCGEAYSIAGYFRVSHSISIVHTATPMVADMMGLWLTVGSFDDPRLKR